MAYPREAIKSQRVQYLIYTFCVVLLNFSTMAACAATDPAEEIADLSCGAALQFEQIANFRDVGCQYNKDNGGVTYMKPNVFFRSARLDNATQGDLRLLATKCRIRTVLDLRSEVETKLKSHQMDAFPAAALGDMSVGEVLGNISQHRRLSSKNGTMVTPPELKDDEDPLSFRQSVTDNRKTIFVNFAGHEYRTQAAWSPLSKLSKAKVCLYMVTLQKPKAARLVGREVIQPKGLEGLNRDFIDFCGKEIVAALRVLANAKNFPVLVHCTQGKDRTGLVIAIALLLCGCKEEYIVMDYNRSQEGLRRQRSVMIREMEKTGLDKSFVDAPSLIMEKTLHYLHARFGSAHHFATAHGLTEQELTNIKSNLLS